MVPRPMPSLEMTAPRRMPPICLAALAQVLSIVLTGLGMLSLQFLGLEIGIVPLLLTQSVLAVAVSFLMGMPSWWLAIQAIFVPALAAALALSIAPTWFLGGFILLALIYGRTYTTQVPLYLSRRRVWLAIQHLLPQAPGLRVLDLGSGLGGLIQHLADVRPDSHVSGIESAPLPCLISKLRIMGRPNAHTEWGDFWQTDLSGYDVVCAYLSPVPMPALWQKVKREMRPGSLFISYRFPIPGVMPAQVVKMNDLGQTELYVWRV
ncbi:MAG: hypothetical protein IV108_12160 [Burkholderiales bacterium]|nr:hypothetical protein [Burkholderiales bacterium]